MPLTKKHYQISKFAFRLLLWFAVAVCSTLSLAADNPRTSITGESTPTYYIYHGQKVDLELKIDQLAVKFKAQAKADNLRPSATALGIDYNSAAPTGIENWHLLDLPVPLSDATDASQKIRKILFLPEVEFASPVFRGLNETWITMTPEILLQFRPEYQAQADVLLKDLAPDLEIVQKDFGRMPGAYILRSSSRNGFEILSAANRLALDPHIDWAESDAQFSGRGALIPNDPGFADLWGFLNTGQFGGTPGMDMDADSAWDIALGCDGVQVLIIDTGVEQDHPDINQLPGKDFMSALGDGGPRNACDNHGTAVAGCVSAIINNALGTVGIAPVCRIVSAKTFNSNLDCSGGWTTNSSATVKALAWAESLGVRVTNNSNFYNASQSSAIEAKYLATYQAGMVHFASAGNFSEPFIQYPASLPGVNAVAALQPDGNLVDINQWGWGSSWGVGLDFSAPGVVMYSTDRTGADGYSSGDYVYFGGTSAASPYAAGVAALILSQDSGLTAAQVETVMQNAARDLGTAGYDTTYGWGFVNANNSVLAVSMADSDTDAVADPCDICPTVFNPLQQSAKPGDANASNNYTLSDVIAIVNYVFNRPGCTPQPLCWLSNLLCRGDWNASSSVTLPDVIQAVNFVFNRPGGPWNPLPVDVCCIPYNQ